VLWRFWASADHDEAFQRVVVSGSQRQAEERELFNFFVNGLASIECACYALYTAASTFDNDAFPVGPKDLQKISPKAVAALFARRSGTIR